MQFIRIPDFWNLSRIVLRKKELNNVETILVTEDNLPLAEGSLDLIFMNETRRKGTITKGSNPGRSTKSLVVVPYQPFKASEASKDEMEDIYNYPKRLERAKQRVVSPITAI